MKQAMYKGRMIDVVEVDVITAQEPWNEYQLADGNILKTRTVLINILKATHEKGKNDSPIYLIHATHHIRTK